MRRSLVLGVIAALAALLIAPSARAWDSANADGTQPVLAVDDNSTCAIREGDTIYCWGINTYGGLGRGNTDPSTAVLPVQTAYASPARSISANGFVACAVLYSGGVACWGYGLSGNIGNGVIGSVSSPTAVTGLTNVTGVSVGPVTECASKQDGSVWCWGNGHGNVVSADSLASSPLAVKRAGVSGALDVGVGNNFACALTAGHTVVCWGENSFGQLGNGTKEDNPTPKAVPGITDATAVAVGLYSVCAVRSGGTVWCWGSNDSGALGIHDAVDTSTTPRQVWGIAGAVSIAEAGYGGCALLTSGTVKCWGAGTFGRLGDEQGAAQFSPVTSTSSQPKTTAIVTSLAHSCEIAGGRVWCWGANTNGKLGNGTINDALAGTGPGNSFGYAAAQTKVPVLNPAPGKPTGASKAAKKVSITWAAPATSNGTSAPTDYVIQYLLKGTTTWKTFKDTVSTARSVTVTGLTSGKYYQFRVSAKNWAGAGSVSAASGYIKSK